MSYNDNNHSNHQMLANNLPRSFALGSSDSVTEISGTVSEPGGGVLAGMAKRLNPIKARRFKPVALWSSTVLTDDNGNAQRKKKHGDCESQRKKKFGEKSCHSRPPYLLCSMCIL